MIQKATRECRFCGEDFELQFINQKYCSAHCSHQGFVHQGNVPHYLPTEEEIAEVAKRIREGKEPGFSKWPEWRLKQRMAPDQLKPYEIPVSQLVVGNGRVMKKGFVE